MDKKQQSEEHTAYALDMSQSMAQAAEKARSYFRQGLNCSECVMRSYMDLHHITLPQEVIGLASGFGGGMGQTKNTCGAVTGAMLALGLKKGRANPFEKESPRERSQELLDIYKPFGNMVNEIEAYYGSLICKELVQPFGEFTSKTRRKGCQDIIGYCAAVATKYAEEEENKSKTGQ